MTAFQNGGTAMKKGLKILLKLAGWLAVLIFCLFLAGHITVYLDFADAMVYLITAILFILFIAARTLIARHIAKKRRKKMHRQRSVSAHQYHTDNKRVPAYDYGYDSCNPILHTYSNAPASGPAKNSTAYHQPAGSAYTHKTTAVYRQRKPTVKTRSRQVYQQKRLLIFLLAAAMILTAVFAGKAVHSAIQRKEIPQSLLELKERYPETASFVNDYPKEIRKKQNMDLSGEVQRGQIPLFLQWDKRWGYKKYGSDFLAITGCGPTCLSMVYSGLTGKTDKNPYQMSRFAQRNGYYYAGKGSSWDLMTEGAQKLGLQAEGLEPSADNIRRSLSDGMPLICSMYPGDFTNSGHFIVLAGLDENGRVIVRDPNSRKNSRKKWKLSHLLPQIRAMWQYTA